MIQGDPKKFILDYLCGTLQLSEVEFRNFSPQGLITLFKYVHKAQDLKVKLWEKELDEPKVL